MNYTKKRTVDLSAVIYPVTLTLLFVIMVIWSWRKWPDILVDFGRELYVPWQISSGQVLYKDLAHLFGPLSAYFNAVLFSIFGTSYTVLVVANILELAVFLTILYLLLDKVSSRWAAFTSCAVVISVFAFSQYVFIGNYNFISPYAHESTHGLILSLLMICQFYLFITNKRNLHLVLAGLMLGFVFLTKAEVFIAAFATASFFLVLYSEKEKSVSSIVKLTGVFSAGVLVPIIGFLIYFGTSMPVPDAAKAVLGTYAILLKSGVASNDFYLRGMGLDDVEGNLLKMALEALAVISAIGIVGLLSHHYVKHKDKLVVRCLCLVGFAGSIGIAFQVGPYNAGRSLPMINIIAFLILLVSYLRLSTKDREQSFHLIPLLLWSVLSFFLLWKMILNSRLVHYGFSLTLPSVVLLIVMLIWFLPEWMDKKGSGGSVFRNVMLMIMIVISCHFIQISNNIYKMKSLPVGTDTDRIIAFHPRVDPRGFFTAQAAEWIRLNVEQDETFVVLPEGVMLNYLTKRRNPTRFTNFMIPEMLSFGEDVILRDFIEHPPDYVVLIHKNTAEYGVGYFGRDPRYGRKIMNWINQNYGAVLLLGKEPLVEDRFGIKILKKI